MIVVPHVAMAEALCENGSIRVAKVEVQCCINIILYGPECARDP